jgi:cytochrome c-type biogenesis protein
MIVRLFVAFGAGFVSVITPCVLPLVPGYLATVSAVDAERLGQRGVARRVTVASLPFFAGFTVVFVLLGIGATAVASTLGSRAQQEIGGFILIVVGFALMGLLPLPKSLVGAGLIGGARKSGSRALLGAAFATCAAPCITPVLAGVLVLAGGTSTVAKGAALLLVYSLGLAFAFLLAGVSFAKAMGTFRWLRDRYRILSVSGGAVLVALGCLLFFDRMWWLRVGLNRFLHLFGLGV